MFQKLVHSGLQKLQQGHVLVVAGDRTRSYGDPGSDLSATVTIHHPSFYRQMVLGGGIGAAESFSQGHWTCPDLTSLIRILIRNLPAGDATRGPLSSIRNASEKVAHFLRRNTVGNARQNIARHYDLSNEFFGLFLDPSMTYSSAIFPRPDCSLYEGSMEKIDRACRKLDLKPDDHLLEIGTGWGALAVHAARQYGCRVTTTTISERQYEWAKQRFEEQGVADRITLLRKDYRELAGQFDKLVSIEMIEAVGHQYFDTFFGKCSELLKPQGEMLLQSITIVDHRFDHHRKTVDFIKRFIFPGGCLPSHAALAQSMSRASRLRILQVEDFAAHYAETLRRWRKAFTDRLPQVRKLGFDERFIRIWEYYLCYCEAAFMERHVNVSQIWLGNYASGSSPLDRQIHLAVPEPETRRDDRLRKNRRPVSEVTP